MKKQAKQPAAKVGKATPAKVTPKAAAKGKNQDNESEIYKKALSHVSVAAKLANDKMKTIGLKFKKMVIMFDDNGIVIDYMTCDEKKSATASKSQQGAKKSSTSIAVKKSRKG